MRKLIFFLLLLSAPTWAAWNFTITGTPALCDDGDMRKNSATTNYGAAVNLTVGYNAGDTLSTWIGFLTLSDTLALPAYSGTVDSAYIRFRFYLDRFDAATDTLMLKMYTCQRTPVEGNGGAGSGITWTTYDGSNNWTTAGAQSTVSDIYADPGDTCILVGDLGPLDYFNIYANPTYCGSGYEHFVIRLFYRNAGVDYTSMRSSNDAGSDECPVLYVFGGGVPPPAVGKGIGGVTLGGTTVGGK